MSDLRKQTWGQSEGVTPCTAFSLTHETILALWELCLTKFLFNGVGTEKKSLLPCYRGRSASFRLSLHSICQDNNPPSPQSFFHLLCPPPHEHCTQTWYTGEPWVTLRSRLEDRATVCELWWRICWPATIQTMTYSLIFRGHGLRTSRGQSTLLTFIKSAVQYAMFKFFPPTVSLTWAQVETRFGYQISCCSINNRVIIGNWKQTKKAIKLDVKKMS